MKKLNQYQKGLVDGAAGCIQAILEECDKEMIELIFEKLGIEKKV